MFELILKFCTVVGIFAVLTVVVVAGFVGWDMWKLRNTTEEEWLKAIGK